MILASLEGDRVLRRVGLSTQETSWQQGQTRKATPTMAPITETRIVTIQLVIVLISLVSRLAMSARSSERSSARSPWWRLRGSCARRTAHESLRLSNFVREVAGSFGN